MSMTQKVIKFVFYLWDLDSKEDKQDQFSCLHFETEPLTEVAKSGRNFLYNCSLSWARNDLSK